MKLIKWSSILDVLALVLSVLIISSCSGGGGGGSVSDTAPPVTTSDIGSGLYGSPQSVTLTSNEPSTIYYSLDGLNPSAGASNTYSHSSPVSGITIGAGTTILKFFAIDTSGNSEAIKSITYTVDLTSPTISLVSPAPGAFGLLTSCTISWQSDKDGSFVVELGGIGTQGTGTVLTSGSVTAGSPATQLVYGYQLSFSASIPLWIYVTDSFGRTGSTSVDLSMKPLATIPIGGEINKLAILPNGQKAYVTRTSADSVAVVDTNPLSASYNTVLATVATGMRPYGLAITPDGSRAYVTNNGSTSLSMISTSTDTVMAIPLGSISAPTGIAITVDGKRGYFLSFDEQINILDTDPGSLNYNSLLGNIPRTLLLMGDIAMSPDGKKAVVNWQGTIAHAVDVIDVDSTSLTYNTIIATPVPVVSGVGADVAVSTDSAFAFATDQNNRLCKIDLQSYTIPITNTSIGGQGAIVISPDGQVLLSSNFNSNKLSVIKTTDLTVITELALGVNLGQHIAITPDGTRAYVERNVLSNSSELVMVPLK